MILICEKCGKTFERDRKRRFCHVICWYEFNRGIPQSPELIAKRSAAMKGIKKSPEHIAKLVLAIKAKRASGTYKAKPPVSEETKKKMSIAAIKRFSLVDRKPRVRVRPKSEWIPVNKKCSTCDSQFLSNHPNTIYCSKKCSNKAQWNKKKLLIVIGKVCTYCQKKYQGRPHQKHCSYECANKHRSENVLATFTCQGCGTQITLRGCEARKRKYCTACLKTYEVRQKISKNGIAALKEVGSVLTENGRTVLSERMTGRNNPMFTHPESCHYNGVKFYKDLGLKLRSGWEANMARIFISLGLRFEYEPKTFMLSDGTTYTPDFYIHETGEFIEVKGYMRKDAQDKINLFKQDFPELPFDIIDASKYKQYVSEFAELGVVHAN